MFTQYEERVKGRRGDGRNAFPHLFNPTLTTGGHEKSAVATTVHHLSLSVVSEQALIWVWLTLYPALLCHVSLFFYVGK